MSDVVATVVDLDLGHVYRAARERLTEVVRSMADDPASVPVPACPGWSVHDVVAHLLGIIEDVMAGRLTGPPSEEESAEQVGWRRGVPTSALLDEWTAL